MSEFSFLVSGYGDNRQSLHWWVILARAILQPAPLRGISNRVALHLVNRSNIQLRCTVLNATPGRFDFRWILLECWYEARCYFYLTHFAWMYLQIGGYLHIGWMSIVFAFTTGADTRQGDHFSRYIDHYYISQQFGPH